MKKLIIFVLTLFLTFTIFLSSKSVNAQITEITPYYGGDILDGKELYLFQNYSATPNFENGYISKKTISQQDVFYQENSFYNGWYKDLGRDLIDAFTEPEHEPENPYFWFYIPLNNMTAQYLQLALIMPEPYESDFYVKFKNETPTNFLTTNGNGDYLITPPTTNMLKEIEWLCYSVYYQDYLASFRTLTAEISYDFGFRAGEMSGFDRGYNTGYATGYNNGYTDGYNEGSIDTQYGINTVLNFNQLYKITQNNTITQDGLTCITSINDNTFTFNGTTTNGSYYEGTYRFPIPQNLIVNHKYYISSFSIGGTKTQDIRFRFSAFGTTDVNQTTPQILTATSTSTRVDYYYGINQTYNNYIVKLMIIDLTQIYGQGNEPTSTQTFIEDFPSQYYPYTTSELINIDYENGYIKGQKLGYNLGYDDGKDAQATQQLTATGWISSIFGGISSLLNIQIFPGVTIGIIVGIPFVISLAYFVIRAFRGGGGA